MGFLETYYNSVIGSLECAIDLLKELEHKVKYDGYDGVTDVVREQTTIFFEHLLKNKAMLIIKDNSPLQIVQDINELKSGALQANSYGFYRYQIHQSKKIEACFQNISMSATLYDSSQTLAVQSISVALSDLSLTSSILNIHYGTDPGVDNSSSTPIPVEPYIVIDRNQISGAICQLKAHYQSIIDYSRTLLNQSGEQSQDSKYGLITEEAESHNLELASGNPSGIKYMTLIPFLIRRVQDLTKRVAELEARLK